MSTVGRDRRTKMNLPEKFTIFLFLYSFVTTYILLRKTYKGRVEEPSQYTYVYSFEVHEDSEELK